MDDAVASDPVLDRVVSTISNIKSRPNYIPQSCDT
jgi:hypothetical protein